MPSPGGFPKKGSSKGDRKYKKRIRQRTNVALPCRSVQPKQSRRQETCSLAVQATTGFIKDKTGQKHQEKAAGQGDPVMRPEEPVAHPHEHRRRRAVPEKRGGQSNPGGQRRRLRRVKHAGDHAPARGEVAGGLQVKEGVAAKTDK